MKTKALIMALATIFSLGAWAQDRTTVTATTTDISDNLDLRAVASLFGDAENLEEFERMLNDPKTKISNLDLNRDNRVDYLRVVESVEDRTHLIVIQAVLERDVFQDVATVEVERDRNNKVQIQVVGDTFMYGPNYIYEPVYVYTPVIYNTFWMPRYRPYWSSWYWGYYPSWYYAWHPVPIYSYCNNVAVYVNHQHQYHYVNVRRSSRAAVMHSGRRTSGYATHYNGRSFADRAKVTNRYELDQIRTSNPATRTAAGTRTQVSGTRTAQSNGTRAVTADQFDAAPTTGTRSQSVTQPRHTAGTKASTPARPRSVTVEQPTRTSVQSSAPAVSSPRQSAPVRTQAAPRTSSYTPASPSRQATQYQPSVRQSAPARVERPAPAPRQSVQPRSSSFDRGSSSSQRQSTPTVRNSVRR